VKETLLKTILPVLLALATSLGAHSCRVEYVQGKDQEAMGRLVMTMNKVCEQEASRASEP